MGLSYSNEQAKVDHAEILDDEERRPVVIDSKHDLEEKENNNRIAVEKKKTFKRTYADSYCQTETIKKAPSKTYSSNCSQTKPISLVLTSCTQTDTVFLTLSIYTQTDPILPELPNDPHIYPTLSIHTRTDTNLTVATSILAYLIGFRVMFLNLSFMQ